MTEALPIHTEARGADTVLALVTVDAARPVVFRTFTDPAVLSQWFWPQRFGTRVGVDLRSGARRRPIATTDRDDHLQGWARSPRPTGRGVRRIRYLRAGPTSWRFASKPSKRLPEQAAD
ncbi:hypothetical protein BH24ACT9_BH24ACT9_04150 [soil metagenome]